MSKDKTKNEKTVRRVLKRVDSVVPKPITTNTGGCLTPEVNKAIADVLTPKSGK